MEESSNFSWAEGPVETVIQEALHRGYGIKYCLGATLDLFDPDTEELIISFLVTRECGGDYVK